YLDVVKDRLYCELKDGVKRKAAQTTMFIILDAFTRMIAPILSFTSEEIWAYMPHKDKDDKRSALYNDMYEKVNIKFDDDFYDKWNNIHDIRDAVKKALEEKRTAKIIGSSLDATVILYCTGHVYDFIKDVLDYLPTVFLVSNVKLESSGTGEYDFEKLGISIDVVKSNGDKCERCWTYSDSVGKDSEHPTLCDRCVDVVKNI
ncbi:MAG: class I tRNA ligase family protein, partial [Oscillospiraceae bacterium]|nr:class I tRNA ligase family protein [Oscillospiraceae bacterium]